VTRTLTRALAAGLVLAFALLASSSFEAAGPGMEEGIALTYPLRIVEGDWPHRDFETFYGPGDYWIVAGAFEVFGSSLVTERAVGLVFRGAILLAVFALALGWGAFGAAAAAIVAGMLMLGPSDLGAYPVFCSLAFGLGALAVLARSRSGRAHLLSGFLAGLALLSRFDFAPAMVLALLPFLHAGDGAARKRLGVGFAAGLSPYVLHLLVVGPDKVEKLVDDFRAFVPGRRLPLPPLSTDRGQLVVIICLGTALLLLVGVRALMRDRRDRLGTVALASGLFCAGLLPYVFSRPDESHLVPGAILPASMLPVVVVALLRELRPGASTRAAAVAAAVTVLAITLFGAPELVRGRAESQLRAVVGPGWSAAYAVENRGHTFYFRSEAEADAVRAAVADVERRASSGDSIFVGANDLRRTNYGDTYLYYLLPRLKPASYFVELNPQTANRAGSGFSGEIARADFLILNRRLDFFVEDNASKKLGPARPNEIVRERFCRISRRGDLDVYRRCR